MEDECESILKKIEENQNKQMSEHVEKNLIIDDFGSFDDDLNDDMVILPSEIKIDQHEEKQAPPLKSRKLAKCNKKGSEDVSADEEWMFCTFDNS
jgi:hypothetical protein